MRRRRGRRTGSSEDRRAADAHDAISAEILTLLHDVYGYDGGQPLKIETETGEAP